MQSGKYILIQFLIAIGICYQVVYSQDIQQLRKEKPIRINGSLSAYNNFISNKNTYKLGYINNYNLNANATLNIYGISLPFSAMYNHRTGFAYNQPFQMYGVSPNYKWIKTHIGYRNINLSNLTLSGISFLGGAIELTPGWFRLSALYGNIRPTSLKDRNNGQLNSTDFKFKRMGYGGKIGFGRSRNYIDLILFKAKDEIVRPLDSIDLSKRKPEENLVAGISTRFTFLKKITLTTEIDGSAYNENTLVEKIDSSISSKIPKQALLLFTPRYNSQVNYAAQSNLQMNFGLVNANVGFRRIMPEYKSLGTNFRGGDIQNINAMLSSALLNGRLNVVVMGGQGHNNLNLKKSTTQYNNNVMIQINAIPLTHLSIGMGYNWFQTYAKPNKNIKADTKYAVNMLTHTINFSPSYSWVKGSKSKTITVNSTYLKLDDKNMETSKLLDNENIQNIVSLTMGNTQTKTNHSISLNSGIIKNNANNSQTIGMGYTLNKNFFKNKINGSASYTINAGNDAQTKKWQYAQNAIRMQCTMQLGKHHSLNTSLAYNYVLRIPLLKLDNNKELNISIGYSYRI